MHTSKRQKYPLQQTFFPFLVVPTAAWPQPLPEIPLYVLLAVTGVTCATLLPQGERQTTASSFRNLHLQLRSMRLLLWTSMVPKGHPSHCKEIKSYLNFLHKVRSVFADGKKPERIGWHLTVTPNFVQDTRGRQTPRSKCSDLPNTTGFTRKCSLYPFLVALSSRGKGNHHLNLVIVLY